jgi:hypothetical protein
MADAPHLALAALSQLERSAERLAPNERAGFRRQLQTIATVLGGHAAPRATAQAARDPYAALLTPDLMVPGRAVPAGAVPAGAFPARAAHAGALGTPLDLEAELGRQGGSAASGGDERGPEQAAGTLPAMGPAPASAAPAAKRPDATEIIGQRVATALEAVAFTDFVAGLVRGTFQAIVDATAQQMREYADLVANISRSADSFTRDNVTVEQARLWLSNRHALDLYVAVPQPGRGGTPTLCVQARSVGQSPEWLDQYQLSGAELNNELSEGPLLAAGRAKLGEERLQNLASMVLMGLNRVVVKDGEIAAKLQFHATAQDRSAAEVAVENRGQQGNIAQRQTEMSAQAITMVSTNKANAQSDANIRADLMGEVRIKFATETFNLNQFADTQAIQLISQHARWRGDVPAAAPATPPPAPGNG